jgi:hypothetical protein
LRTGAGEEQAGDRSWEQELGAGPEGRLEAGKICCAMSVKLTMEVRMRVTYLSREWWWKAVEAKGR